MQTQTDNFKDCFRSCVIPERKVLALNSIFKSLLVDQFKDPNGIQTIDPHTNLLLLFELFVAHHRPGKGHKYIYQ